MFCFRACNHANTLSLASLQLSPGKLTSTSCCAQSVNCDTRADRHAPQQCAGAYVTAWWGGKDTHFGSECNLRLSRGEQEETLDKERYYRCNRHREAELESKLTLKTLICQSKFFKKFFFLFFFVMKRGRKQRPQIHQLVQLYKLNGIWFKTVI